MNDATPTALEEKWEQEKQENERKAKQLPDPCGYHLLCAIPEIEEKFDNSLIIKADATMNHEEILTTVLFVIKMGPDAYQDKTKFPSGPWCKTGDFVVIRPNSGTRLDIHGKEFRLINDDSVEAVIEDPRGVRRK
jgi:co-chaperonin GroES (HSP10)